MDASPSPSSRRTPAGPPRFFAFSLSRFPAFLRQYFSSGWAFLIPYLLAYLLYYRLKWPVQTSASHVPPLLHVYWALHVLHLLLGFLSLLVWWREIRISNFHLLPLRSTAKTGPLSHFLPWFLLALVFLIPGAYLEFPADPWEHLTRIMHWADQGTIQVLYKTFGYSIPYSLFGYSHEGLRSFQIDIYYTGICLVLCWQYFRLGRAVGLSACAAFLFVLLQVLLFGNSVFSFYLYYGIASTIYSQIGAIALIRIGLEFASRKSPTENPPPSPALPTFPLFRFSAFPLSAICLLLLIALDHVQGLGIAALGLAAVAVWWLLAWRRSMAWLLIAAVLILSVATILWWPRHPAIDGAYRPLGVLTAWYGFNLFSSPPIAGNRTIQILGLFGVVNLLAGILLVRRNHVVGWLTITPVLALCLPFVAIPFAGALAQAGSWGNIIVFHRMFFAVPAGLAVVALINRFQQHFLNNGKEKAFHTSCVKPCALMVFALLALTTIPTRGPFYNRFWNALVKPANDLAMRRVANDFHRYIHAAPHRADAFYASTAGLSFVLHTDQQVPTIPFGRTYYNDGVIPAADLGLVKAVLLQHLAAGDAITVVPRSTVFYTAYSFAAICSGHWLPQEVALAYSGAPELRVLSSRLGMHASDPVMPITYYSK